MEPIVGIDLGTTNSYIAVMEGEHPTVLLTPEGRTAMPALVAVATNGRRVVGVEARNMEVTNAQNTVTGVTRLLGRRASADVVKSIAKRVPYRLARGPEDAVFIRLPGWNARPEEICMMILATQREQAERYLEHEVKQAVLAVPTYFDAPQEAALVTAARLAGFGEVSTVPQTVAAAHAHGYMDRPGATVAVYHFGGGAFEVALLSIGAVTTEVLGNAGDAFLGGADIDDHVVSWFVSRTLEEHGIDLSTSVAALQSLHLPARLAKRRLAEEQEAEIRLAHVDADGEPIELRQTLSRAVLERMSAPLIQQTIDISAGLLRHLGIGLHQITDVLMVGGQSRMPLVQRMVGQLFQRTPTLTAAPEETIAVGACIGSRSGGEDEPLELAY